MLVYDMSALSSEWKRIIRPPKRKKSILKKIIRQKALVIPYLLSSSGSVRYLVVKDKMHDEYTFISGCCKKSEHITTCAIRELREESKDAVNISFEKFDVKRFIVETYSRECDEYKEDLKKNERILTVYHVFLIDISFYKSPNEMVEIFKNSKKVSKAYNENSDLSCMTLDQFKAKKMWSFIRWKF